MPLAARSSALVARRRLRAVPRWRTPAGEASPLKAAGPPSASPECGRLLVGLATDDEDWSQAARRSLRAQGLEVVTADLLGADKDPALGGCHIILLKPARTGGACWSACLRLAHRRESLLVFVHDAADASDNVLALELGADDCIAASLDPREMAARLRALGRRFTVGVSPVATPEPDERVTSPVYYFSGWRFAPTTAELRGPSGRIHHLPANDMKLIAELLRTPGRFISSQELSERLTVRPSARVDCRSRVHRLRVRLLKTEENVDWLKTVYGRGYCLDAEVRRVEEPAPERAGAGETTFPAAR